ncbi:MAG: 3-hydroxyacyl-CoA dehydrogenase NAD-binding domain-containing protein, partial [Actinomycetota bacterium]|nr:3-hydroxyacyl-CoA dehydrogenase NAD-binding domain-containing protein [Actinomycetota bacterium]
MSIERVGIVGGGQMGGGIAEVCVKAGVDTIIVEINDDLVAHSKAGIEKSLGKAVDRGKLEADAREAALSLLTFSTDRASLADRDL